MLHLQTENIKPIDKLDLQLVFRGNSLFRSHHDTGVEQYLPMRVRDYFAGKTKSLEFHSFGVGGEQIQTILSDYTTVVQPLINTNKTSILYLSEDANSIGGGGISGTSNISYMNQIIDLALLDGFNYIVIMLGWNVRSPYNTNWSDSSARSRRQDWYNLVEQGGLNNRVFILDGRNLQLIGGSENQSQNEYFYDHIHLNQLGWDIVADTGLIPLTLSILQ